MLLHANTELLPFPANEPSETPTLRELLVFDDAPSGRIISHDLRAIAKWLRESQKNPF